MLKMNQIKFGHLVWSKMAWWCWTSSWKKNTHNKTDDSINRWSTGKNNFQNKKKQLKKIHTQSDPIQWCVTIECVRNK